MDATPPPQPPQHSIRLGITFTDAGIPVLAACDASFDGASTTTVFNGLCCLLEHSSELASAIAKMLADATGQHINKVRGDAEAAIRHKRHNERAAKVVVAKELPKSLNGHAGRLRLSE